MSNFTTWRSLVDGEEVGGIPDSELSQTFIHLDADEIEANDNDEITTWEDLTDNNNDVTAINGRPTYDSDFQNGRGVLQFNDTPMDTAFAEESQPNTIITVVHGQSTFQTGETADCIVDSQTGTDTFHLHRIFDKSSDRGPTYRNFAGDSYESEENDVIDDFHIFTSVFDGANSAIRANGSILSTREDNDNVGPNGLNGVTIGHRNDLTTENDELIGPLGTVVISNTAESEVDIENEELRLGRRWGIDITFTATETNSTTNDSRQMVADGDYLYVGGGHNTDGLTIIDVSDPRNPQFESLTGTVTDIGHGVAKKGDYAYVSGRASGSIEVFDVSDPTNPTIVDSISNSDRQGSLGLHIVDNTLYCAVAGDNDPDVSDSVDGGLQAVDITDPTNISETAFISSDVDGSIYPERKPGTDTLLLTPYRADRFSTFDISDRNNPSLNVSTSFEELDDGRGLDVKGDTAFIADQNGRVLSIDVSDPNNPSQIDSLSDSDLNGARECRLSNSGNQLVVAGRQSDIATILDVSDESNLTKEGTISDAEFRELYGVEIDGDRLYLTNADWQEDGDTGDVHVVRSSKIE